MMIFPDIYLLSGFPFQIHQNVYGIDFPEENRMVLIDTGLDETDRIQIQETMKTWGLEKRKISDVFLTHAHFDHAGNAFWFEKAGAHVWAGEADADSIEKGDVHTIFFAYGKPFPTCQKVRRLKDGEKILLNDSCKLNCFYTPGHTKGSMCYEFVGKGKKILFTGDFLQAGEEDGSVRMGIRVDPGYSFKEYLSSVKRMMNVESKAVLPGHFRPYLKPAFELMQAAYRELLVNREKYKD
ncbi:MBL fold metallo-hydrolase [Blautia massiliensis (ex Durand et al. 2017)]|uniref:MBL fold metallo-hydrolase n=1 Tax=Blautia massiliensis (ex Durand et al. 2017) TaxID=1737424 RepID=UPI0039A09ACC